jgi:hypothetical protein
VIEAVGEEGMIGGKAFSRDGQRMIRFSFGGKDESVESA